MTKINLISAVAAAIAISAIAASAPAQNAGEASSTLKMAPQTTKPGDADGAFIVSGKFSEPDGEKLYRRVCAACHMADGKGATGAGSYPSLTRNEKLAAAGYPVYVVAHGLNGMPPVGQMMTDQQVADVVNYVRRTFGNRYRDQVKPEDVKAVR